MNKYFNVFLEFDHKKFYKTIEQVISERGKGYVCVVDSNVLTIAQKDEEYKSVINSSLINTCDGSSIALLAGWIYKSKFKALNGPEIFEFYVEKPYKQLLLGSTDEVVLKIKQKLISKGIETSYLNTLSVPFCSVDKFDYVGIAEKIKMLNPDIIWVSLGAPKQELFMYRLMPYLDKGIMFGIGAAFNFYIGELSIPKFRIGRLRFIWLNRLFQEPRKLTKRLLQTLITFPKMFWNELRNKNAMK